MKKLLTAAIAALFVVTPTFADVSLSGDAYMILGFKTYDPASDGVLTGFNGESLGNDNSSDTTSRFNRIRLNVDGTAGNTSIHARFRNDSSTRVSNSDDSNAALLTDWFYFKTSVGMINIKYGDWWHGGVFGEDNVVHNYDELGSGADDILELSTNLGGWTFTAASMQNDGAMVVDTDDSDEDGDSTDLVYSDDSSSVRDSMYFKLAGNMYGFDIGLDHFNNMMTTELVVITNIDGSTSTEDSNAYDYFTASGDIAGVGVGVRVLNSAFVDADAWDIKVTKSINGINLQAGYGQFGPQFANAGYDSGSYSLGGEGALQGEYDLWQGLSNVNPGEDSTIYGVYADMNAVGMNFKVGVGEYDVGQNDSDIVDGLDCQNIAFCDEDSLFTDLMVTYPLSSSSNLKGIYGAWAGEQVMGAKIDMTF